jgi:hypothetical protein
VIGLLPMGRLIVSIAVMYAALIVLAEAVSLRLSDHSQSILGSISLAFAGATTLQLLLVAWFYIGWRRLWRWFPVLNRLFPDVNGEWNIRIHWRGIVDSGVVDAKATVRQDFLRISMEVQSAHSDSQTLIAQPRRDPESGRAILYYVYLVIPKGMRPNAGQPYHGAAVLKFSEANGGQLGGNYWTTQKTSGYFQLSRKRSGKVPRDKLSRKSHEV